MVRWFDWDKSVFVKSKKEKKPVLLCVGASWCHWCHTMDRLAYSDKEIVNFINANFVAVRVDTDKRPDVNERYNVGGWPSTVVLASDGELIWAATYVAKENMLSFLEKGLIAFKKYKSKKSKIVKQSLRFDSEQFYSQLNSFFDPVNGGFGLEPKFFYSDLLGFLIWRVSVLKDSHARQMLDLTCARMSKGQVFDKVEGGFFRYAAHQDWSFPHFEKLLEDNGYLLSLYFWAYKLFNKDEYLTVINKNLYWLFTMLYDHSSGLFFASQDADEGYCKLPLTERGKHSPAVDRTILTDANAVLAISFFHLSMIDKDYEKLALRLLDSLYKLNVRGLVAHSNSDKPLYLFKDQIYLFGALVQAFAQTGKLEWKSKALSVAKGLEKFYDKKNGGFFDVLPNGIGRLKLRKKQVHENGFAVLVLKSFAQLTGDSKYLKMAEKTLKGVETEAVLAGPLAATYAIARAEMQK